MSCVGDISGGVSTNCGNRVPMEECELVDGDRQTYIGKCWIDEVIEAIDVSRRMGENIVIKM